MFLRLRQLCLVAEQLDPVIADLRAVFDVPVCHRDPAVACFGLHNALVALGPGFVEVVAPLRAGTTAGRYLERRGGPGGYMVILETDDLGHWRGHVDALGVRVAAALAQGDYEGLQLHPRDTGGALLEINTTRGNSADPYGPYGPAGVHWQDSVRTGRVRAITGAVLHGRDPARLAQRWGEILQRPARLGADGWQLALDNAVLRFVEATEGRGEGLGAIEIDAVDVPAIIRTARARGCDATERGVVVGGVVFRWRAER
ncbi:MAG TPA: VOC family protein [Ottowia sp.]|mgnify:CR=1 FL=1|uniref:VOC family protein n=1 Tax=Ottowia sp. TaxID=1898956 RepID=UPI002CFD9B51|nr:VOC family protein [Ottowia sp.]HMN20530.1 VOC family protein [Ottowia sp.]